MIIKKISAPIYNINEEGLFANRDYADGRLIPSIVISSEEDNYIKEIIKLHSNISMGQTYTLVTTSLSELQEDEMKLIQNSVRLDCATLPTVAQHHTLTVSFELDTDRTATYYVELDFAATEAQ